MPSRSETWVSTLTAAKVAGVCRGTIYNYINSGELPARRLGGKHGRYRIRMADVEVLAEGAPVEPQRVAP